jgi:hypothetical protein
MMRRTLSAVVAVTLVLAVAGCTADWLLGADGSPPPSPTASEDPDPTPSATPSGSSGPIEECAGDLVITRPGTYLLGDCDTLTLEGTGIVVEAASVGHLIVRGDDNELRASSGIGSVTVSGNSNTVTSQTSIGTIVESGQDNNIGVAR